MCSIHQPISQRKKLRHENVLSLTQDRMARHLMFPLIRWPTAGKTEGWGWGHCLRRRHEGNFWSSGSQSGVTNHPPHPNQGTFGSAWKRFWLSKLRGVLKDDVPVASRCMTGCSTSHLQGNAGQSPSEIPPHTSQND